MNAVARAAARAAVAAAARRATAPRRTAPPVYGAPVTAPAPGEHIGAPKDGEPAKPLPKDSDKPKDTDKPKEVKAPAPFEVAPASTITIEKDNRNPF